VAAKGPLADVFRSGSDAGSVRGDGLSCPGISDRNRNKLNIGEFPMGLRKTARRAMHLSLVEALLAVAVLSTAFLAEIFVFVALGLI